MPFNEASFRLRELEAQEHGAAATRTGAIATIVQAALGAIGTIFLVLTLMETRRATSIAAEANGQAAEAFAASERPWIVVTKVNLLGPVHLDSDHFQIGYAITLRNVGRTVATHVIQGSVATVERRGTLTEVIDPIRAEHVRDYPQFISMTVGHLLVPGEELVQEGRCTLPMKDVLPTIPSVDQAIRPFIVGCVTYTNAATGKLHQTGFGYAIQRQLPPNLPPWARSPLWITDGIIPIEQLEAQTWSAGAFAT